MTYRLLRATGAGLTGRSYSAYKSFMRCRNMKAVPILRRSDPVVLIWSLSAMLMVGTALLPMPPASAAEEKENRATSPETKKDDGMRVKDLPKPIPDAMDAIQKFGNRVGEEITKGASAAAGAVNKALKGNKNKKDTEPDSKERP